MSPHLCLGWDPGAPAWLGGGLSPAGTHRASPGSLCRCHQLAHKAWQGVPGQPMGLSFVGRGGMCGADSIPTSPAALTQRADITPFPRSPTPTVSPSHAPVGSDKGG